MVLMMQHSKLGEIVNMTDVMINSKMQLSKCFLTDLRHTWRAKLEGMASAAASTVAHGTHDRPTTNVSIPAMLPSPSRLSSLPPHPTSTTANPPPRHVFPALTPV